MALRKDLVRIPTEIDKYAGRQLKKIRLERNLSQRDLADKIGVTFQQIQKYEKGLNRIGVGRLYDICNILDIKPSYFFVIDGVGMGSENILEGKLAEGADTSLVTELLLLFRELETETQQEIINYIKNIKKGQ